MSSIVRDHLETRPGLLTYLIRTFGAYVSAQIFNVRALFKWIYTTGTLAESANVSPICCKRYSESQLV